MLAKFFLEFLVLYILLLYSVGFCSESVKHTGKQHFENLSNQASLTRSDLKNLQMNNKNKDQSLQKKFQNQSAHLNKLMKKLKIADFTFPFSLNKVNAISSSQSRQTVKNVLINGSNAATINIGDSVVVTFDITTGVLTALLNVYVDVNQNGILDAGDIQLDYPHTLFDNSVEDGDTKVGFFRYVLPEENMQEINRRNFDFIIEVNDGYSSGNASLSVRQVVTGYYLSGSTFPAYENITISADHWEIGQYVTLTDEKGNYIIYVPDESPREWDLSAVDFLQIHGNVIPPITQKIYINGAINNYNFLFQQADAWIQGTVMDEDSNGVEHLHIITENDIPRFLLDSTDASGNFQGGVLFNFYYVRLWLTAMDLWPDYLAPLNYKEVTPVLGDTISTTISVYQTDSNISGYVYLNGLPVWGILIVGVSMDHQHYTITFTNLDGSYQLPVASELDVHGGYFVFPAGFPAGLPEDIYCTPEKHENVSSGSFDINFNLTQIKGGIQGYINDHQTGFAIENTFISIHNDSLWYDVVTNGQGYYRIMSFPGEYIMDVNHWDYVPIESMNLIIQDKLLQRDYQLVQYGDCALSGIITNETGIHLEGARILLNDFYSNLYKYQAFSDSLGNFEIMGIETGYYKLRCEAYYIEPGYIIEYYDNTIFSDSATLVYGIPSTTVDTLDFELSVGGGISGTIREEVSGISIPQTYINALDFETNDFLGSTISENGHYILKGLPTRDILIRAAAVGFGVEYYDNVNDPIMATPVVVVIPNITPNINFSLTPDGSIFKQTAANLIISIGNTGKIGESGHPFWPGCEWPLDSQVNYLYEGGIWIGGDPVFPVVTTSSYDEEFKAISSFITSTQISDEDVEVWYSDNSIYNPFPLGFNVHQSSYAWNSVNYILFRYILHYDGSWGSQEIYVGYFMDYDVASGASNLFSSDDMTGYDSLNLISYVYDDDGDGGLSPGYAGIRILSPTPTMNAYWDIGNDPYEDLEKFNYLSNSSFMGNSTIANDYRILQGTGPIVVHPGDSVTLYLAFAVGDSLDELQNSIMEAYQKFLQITSIDSKESGQLPNSLALYPNYPNPFNPATTIRFDLPKSSVVTLRIYNILGEEVATLVSDRLPAGSYSYDWNASNFASGVYLYRLQAGDYVETRKMVLMR